MASTGPPPVPNPVYIETVNFRVTLILSYSRGQAPHPSRSGSATGFFYQKGDDKYLITNRHVAIDEDEEYYPDFIKIKVHSDNRTLLNTRNIDIPLYDEGNKIWLEHRDNDGIQIVNDKIDVIAIKINDFLSPTDLIQFFSSRDFPLPDTRINLGDSCIVVGFPYAFHDTQHYLPVVRSGTIASTWRSHFRGKKMFLVDSNLHPGTSGSPVIIPESNVRRDGGGVGLGLYPLLLLGINSAESLEKGFNLNIIWYYFLIEEILS